MAININFLSNVSSLLRGGKDAVEALEDVADSLDDVASDAQRTDLEGPLKEGEAAADRTTAAIDGVHDALGDVDGAARRTDLDGALKDGETAADRTADAVGEVADALKETDRVATSADLEKPLEGARTEGDRLEKTFKELAEAVRDTEKVNKGAGDQMRKGMRDTREETDRATQGVEDLRDESEQSAKEFAASFSGDPVDALDSLRDVAANALGGFGPLGLVAGVALAAGLGYAQNKLEELAEQANELKENAAGIAFDLVGADDAERIEALKGQFEELATSIVDTKEWYEVWQDEAVTGIEVIAAAANENGELVAGFMDAFNTTDPIERQQALADSLETVKNSAQQMRDEISQLTADNTTYTATMGGTVVATTSLTDAEKKHIAELKEKASSLEDLTPEIEELVKAQEAENKITQALADSHGVTVEELHKHQRAEEELTAAVESYGDALEANAEPTSVYQKLLNEQQEKARETAQAIADSTADTSDSWEDYAGDVEVSTQDLINEWNRQADEAQEFQQNLAIISAAGGDALAQELLAKGPEVAGAVAEVIAKSDPAEQQRVIDAHTRATGSAMTTGMAQGLESNSWEIQDTVSTMINNTQVPDLAVPWRLNNDLQWQVDQAARSIRSPYITALIQPRVETYP